MMRGVAERSALILTGWTKNDKIERKQRVRGCTSSQSALLPSLETVQTCFCLQFGVSEVPVKKQERLGAHALYIASQVVDARGMRTQQNWLLDALTRARSTNSVTWNGRRAPTFDAAEKGHRREMLQESALDSCKSTGKRFKKRTLASVLKRAAAAVNTCFNVVAIVLFRN